MKALIKYIVCVSIMMTTMSFRSSYDDTSKIYIMALKEHISRIEKIILSQSEKKEFTHAPIFLINECGIQLPEELGSHRLQELGDSAGAFISDSNALHAIKLNPVSVDRGDIVVILSDYIVTKVKKETKFAYGGGREYVFNYDSKRQFYRIIRTKPISF
jgi:hypothetical protein